MLTSSAAGPLGGATELCRNAWCHPGALRRSVSHDLGAKIVDVPERDGAAPDGPRHSRWTVPDSVVTQSCERHRGGRIENAPFVEVAELEQSRFGSSPVRRAGGSGAVIRCTAHGPIGSKLMALPRLPTRWDVQCRERRTPHSHDLGPSDHGRRHIGRCGSNRSRRSPAGARTRIDVSAVGAYASAVRTVVTNGLVLDTATMSFHGEAAVVIEDGVIVDVPDRYAGTDHERRALSAGGPHRARRPWRVRRCRRVAGRPDCRDRRVCRRRRLAQPRDPGRPCGRRTVSGFRSIIWFKVRPGAETAFESAFDDAGMLTRPIQIDGFGGAELLRSTTSPDEYHVVCRWSSPAAYAAWHAISNDGAPPKRSPDSSTPSPSTVRASSTTQSARPTRVNRDVTRRARREPLRTSRRSSRPIFNRNAVPGLDAA